jgi:hypothetical protein
MPSNFADTDGETPMEDVDITLQPKKLFKDNPPLRLSDNLAASWCNICHVPKDIAVGETDQDQSSKMDTHPTRSRRQTASADRHKSTADAARFVRRL